MLIQWLSRQYQADTGDNASTGTAQGAIADPAPPPAAPADDDFDKERAMATIKSLRAFEKDAKAKIKRLEEFEAAEAARSEADLSEAEQLRKRLAKLQADHDAAQASLQRAQIKDAAREAVGGLSLAWQPGALDDALALGAFADLEWTEDGQPKGLNDLLRRLQKQRPYLFKQPAPPGDIGATANGRQSLANERTQKLERNAPRWGLKLRE